MENIIYQYIRGSVAHGISTPQSDVDMGGIFVASLDDVLGVGLNYKDEVSDERHDVVYWELTKYMRLLLKSNPSVLESLFVDPNMVLKRDPVMSSLLANRDMFLTKECFKPFGHYASSQISRARGLNKMINKPILERATPLDFCYITLDSDTVPLKRWLHITGRSEDSISLAKLNHARDAYAVYLYPGGVCRENANDVHTTNIPKGTQAGAVLFFNKDAYTRHCKDYKAQREWETHRNPARYESNLGHSYDSKNMSECLRLVHTCTEIANGESYHVNRQGIDADLLLDIRNHKYDYDELMGICDKAVEDMNTAIEHSTIPDSVDPAMVDTMASEMRKKIYNI